MAELKPCKRCGGTRCVLQYRHGCFVVVCMRCDMTSEYKKTEEKAIEAWNRRAGDGK